MNYSYFSGANVRIKLDNNTILECAGISFNLSNSAQPAYGYASQEFDMVLPGRKLLQGSFVVNYTEANYLTTLIYDVKQDTVEDITDRNKLFDITIEYGGSNKRRDVVLKNCYLISRGQTIQISEQVILEEFSFIGQAIENDNVASSNSLEIMKKRVRELEEEEELEEETISNKNNNKRIIFFLELALFDQEDPANENSGKSAIWYLAREDIVKYLESLKNINYLIFSGLPSFAKHYSGTNAVKRFKKEMFNKAEPHLTGNLPSSLRQLQEEVEELELNNPRFENYLIFVTANASMYDRDSVKDVTFDGLEKLQYKERNLVVATYTDDCYFLSDDKIALSDNNKFGDSYNNIKNELDNNVETINDFNMYCSHYMYLKEVLTEITKKIKEA